jgi:excisionase family DNA binding protein
LSLPTITPAKIEEDLERLLTVREVAYRLNISPSTCYALLKRGEIRCHRIGGSRRVHPRDLATYLVSSVERP